MMNVLIVGLGSIAHKHIIALNSLERHLNIYALRSAKNSDNYAGITNVNHIDEVKGAIDFAIISNPTNLHYEFIDLFVNKGINIFIEKPPVSTLNNVESLLDKINNAKIKNYVACNLRFHPCIDYFKNFLNTNPRERINEVNIYCGSYLPEWRPGKDFREIYSANADMGGGVHLDLFHELDYTFWFFGKPLNTHITKRSASSLDINSVDYANYILEYQNFSTNIVLNYYRRDPKRTVEILFDKETWTIDLLQNNIKSNTGEIIFEAKNFDIKDTYKTQMRYYINCLIDNQIPMNTFAESIETLKICLSNE